MKLAQANSATPDDRDLLANCQTNRADVLRLSGQLELAVATCKCALTTRESLIAAHPDRPAFRTGLGETYLRLGQVRYDLGDLTGAATDWKAACAQYDVIKSTTGNHKFMMACCHAGLAGLAGRPGSGVSAAERANQAEEAMAILRRRSRLATAKPTLIGTKRPWAHSAGVRTFSCRCWTS